MNVRRNVNPTTFFLDLFDIFKNVKLSNQSSENLKKYFYSSRDLCRKCMKVENKFYGHKFFLVEDSTYWIRKMRPHPLSTERSRADRQSDKQTNIHTKTVKLHDPCSEQSMYCTCARDSLETIHALTLAKGLTSCSRLHPFHSRHSKKKILKLKKEWMLKC